MARLSPTAVGEPLPATPAPGNTPVIGSRLLVRSEPRGATVTIDGRRRGTTPVSISDLSVGTHHMRLENGGSRVDQDVTLADGTTNSVLVAMNAAGWLDVRAPFDMKVLEGGHMLGTSADGALSLRAGSHRLELRNDSVGYRNSVDVSVRGGDLTTLRPTIPDAVVQVNAQPWATVFLDGTPVGETPLGNLHVALGSHEIRFRHPQLGEQVRQVMVSADVPVHLSVDLRR